MEEFFGAVRDALGNFHFLILFAAFLLSGFLIPKGLKRRFLVPCLIISIVILNPWFYQLWNRINEYAYWRTLWIIPVIPVCAAVPALLMEKSPKNRLTVVIPFLASALMILVGSYVYTTPRATFVRAENADKLPTDAVLVAEALLEMDEEPRVVSDSALSPYLRQYSARIHSPYSRSAVFGSISQVGSEMYQHLLAGEMAPLAELMRKGNYRYLVTDNSDKTRQTAIEEAGFSLLRQINSFGIYLLRESAV